MLVAIIADTHLPRRTRKLPSSCVERLRDADLIIHAGDLTALGVLDELRSYGEVAAVHGNADDGAARAALPATIELDLDGANVVVTHDGGRRAGRLQRLRRGFPAADAVIFGHSHIPLHEEDAAGFQIFNPGSPTDRRRSPRHTMGIATANRRGIHFRLVGLD